MSIKKTVIACVAVTFIASGVSGAIAWHGRGEYDKFYSTTELRDKVSTVKNILDSDFLYDYDQETLSDGAALGMTMALEDPYTVYYNKKQFADYVKMGTGDFVGIGVTVVLDKDNNEILVSAVNDNSPGYEAGVVAGDVIVAIDGKRYTGAEMSDAVTYIRGINSEESVENTAVTVTVRRGTEEIDLNIIRRKIHETTVKSEMKDNGIGYIRISEFNTGADGEKSTSEEFKSALDDLLSQNMQKLIIDVRDNGGGDAKVVSEIIDRLVPEGLIMYTENKYGKRGEVSSDATELNVPMVVLTNGNSASASELLTGALRDYGKAKIVGTKTYGKGVMQQVYPLSDGSGLVVTIAKYFTPGGTCVQDVGITPDIVVENKAEKPILTLTDDEDLQLKKAIEVLN